MGQTCWRTAKSKSGLDSKIQFNGVGELRTLILAPRGRLRFLSSLTLVLAGKRAFGMLASDGRSPVQGASLRIREIAVALAFLPARRRSYLIVISQ
jgi:hypothetical protein